MNDRQRELVRLLLANKEEAVQIIEIAKKLGCAEKTVRNDLDRLEEYLRDYASANLIRKPGIGISIEMDEEDQSTLINNTFSLIHKTMEERLLEIAFELLISDQAITLHQFSDEYFVTRAIIKKDMETISAWLQRFDLQLISKPRIGHMLHGSELNKRHALAHLSGLLPLGQSKKNYVLDLFKPSEIAAVRKALKDMQEEFSISFTEGAVESLLVHTLVMIKRTRQKSPVFIHEEEKEKALLWKEYEYASWLFGQLEQVIQLSFPENEQVYFTWQIISGKRTGEETLEQLEYSNNEIEIVNVLITKMEKLTLFTFKSDPILLKGLRVHLHSVISRIKYGFPITNPLLPNIKKMYPYMFNMVILTLEEISTTFSLEIPEDEAAYILHH